jgi:hypothetical protein
MIVRESISFERHKDAKQTLNIGMRTKIQEWLEEYFHNISNATKSTKYTINDDLTIDLDGFFATHWMGNFPEWIQFGKTGSFQLQGDGMRKGDNGKNLMTSLRGCPRIIYGDFNCSRQNLTNLVGGPEEVYGNYSCSLNRNIKSFEGIAKKINGDFSCNNNSGLTERDIPTECRLYIEGNINVHKWSPEVWQDGD